MNTFIKLNGKLFEYVSRKFESEEIGSGIQRSLNGTATKDYVATKNRWSFFLEIDERNLSRLKFIFDTHTTITMIDWNGTSYSVLWTNTFSPNFEGEDIHTITIELEEV